MKKNTTLDYKIQPITETEEALSVRPAYKSLCAAILYLAWKDSLDPRFAHKSADNSYDPFKFAEGDLAKVCCYFIGIPHHSYVKIMGNESKAEDAHVFCTMRKNLKNKSKSKEIEEFEEEWEDERY